MASEVIHYHGTPIWGNKGQVLKLAITGGGAFVSYARPDQINQCLKMANAVAIDNGAFSSWKRGLNIDWTKFYQWLGRYYHHEKLKFFIIPDQVDGYEYQNNILINSVPSMFKEKAVPVWHLNESINKLIWLCKEFERVAFGSSGKYAVIRTKAWHRRMNEAFEAIKGIKVKIHGLRMLDGRVLGMYPFSSADSTNLASNVPKWRVKYPNIGKHIVNRNPFTAEDKLELIMYRCATLKNTIEKVTPPVASYYYQNKLAR